MAELEKYNLMDLTYEEMCWLRNAVISESAKNMEAYYEKPNHPTAKQRQALAMHILDRIFSALHEPESQKSHVFDETEIQSLVDDKVRTIVQEAFESTKSSIEADIKAKKDMENNQTTRKGNEIMDTQELADYLNVAQGTIRGWVFDRTIPFFKMGACVRFNKSDIDEWRNSRSNQVGSKKNG